MMILSQKCSPACAHWFRPSGVTPAFQTQRRPRQKCSLLPKLTSQLHRYISPSLSHSCTAVSGTQREELKQRKLAERCPDGCTTSCDEHSFSAHLFSQVRAPEQHDITFVFPPPLTCCIRGFYSVCSSSDGHSRLQT